MQLKGLDQIYFDKLKELFGGDGNATWMWLKTPNPKLGNESPLKMIRDGRVNLVKDQIKRMTEYEC